MGRGRLTTGERTKCSAKKPRLLQTAPHSSDSDGPAPCAGFSAGRVSLHCSRGTPRSACARGGQGTQVTLRWMCRGTGVSGVTLDGWGAQGSEHPQMYERTRDLRSSLDGGHTGAPGAPWMDPQSPPRDWGTHMMKAVTPMAQMSVCGTAPWPSRSSGAGVDTGERTGERLGVRNAMGREAGPGGGGASSWPTLPPRSGWHLLPAHPWSPRNP